MPQYKFRVSAADNSISELCIECENLASAKRRVKARKLQILASLGEVQAGQDSGTLFAKKVDILAFTEQLVPLLEAGIELEKALETLADGQSHPAQRLLIEEIRQALHEGKKFSQIIESRGPVFPRFYSRMLAVGEESGSLSLVLQQILRYLQHQKALRGQLVTASIYPSIILMVSVSVLLFMLGFIVPKFESIFLKLKKTPQGFTRLLFEASDLLTHWGFLLIPLLILLPFALAILLKNDKTSAHLDVFLLRLPLLGKVATSFNAAIFLRALSTMLHSGMHLLNSLQIAIALVPNTELRRRLAGLPERLRRGEKLSLSFADTGLLPKPLLKMLAVGEQTGKLADMLNRVSIQEEEKLQSQIKILLSVVEPLLILGLGVIIGSIVLTMFFAISDLTRLH